MPVITPTVKAVLSWWRSIDVGTLVSTGELVLSCARLVAKQI